MTSRQRQCTLTALSPSMAARLGPGAAARGSTPFAAKRRRQSSASRSRADLPLWTQYLAHRTASPRRPHISKRDAMEERSAGSKRGIAERPDGIVMAPFFLASAYARENRKAEAERTLAQWKHLHPDLTVAQIRSCWAVQSTVPRPRRRRPRERGLAQARMNSSDELGRPSGSPRCRLVFGSLGEGLHDNPRRQPDLATGMRRAFRAQSRGDLD